MTASFGGTDSINISEISRDKHRNAGGTDRAKQQPAIMEILTSQVDNTKPRILNICRFWRGVRQICKWKKDEERKKNRTKTRKFSSVNFGKMYNLLSQQTINDS